MIFLGEAPQLHHDPAAFAAASPSRSRSSQALGAALRLTGLVAAFAAGTA
jgi:hypothetical protein